MTKFKVGDLVRRHNCRWSDWGGMRIGDTSIVSEISADGVRLRDYDGLHSANNIELVDEELPPAPDSVMYFNSNATHGNDQRLIVDTTRAGEIVVNVVRRGCQYKPYDRTNALSVGLEPDDAIQLAHDIYRMARAAKKAQEGKA